MHVSCEKYCVVHKDLPSYNNSPAGRFRQKRTNMKEDISMLGMVSSEESLKGGENHALCSRDGSTR